MPLFITGLKMVVRAHCGNQRHAGLCLGPRPDASHSPFYNMEYKITRIKDKIRCESKRTFHASISPPVGIMHPSQPPLSTWEITSQSYSNPWRHNSNVTQRSLLRLGVNGTEIVWNLQIGTRTYLFRHAGGQTYGYWQCFIWRVITWYWLNKACRILLN